VITDLKPYPTYKESGIEWLGEVPEGWGVRRLKYATEPLVNGIWGSDPEGMNDISCVRVADFDRDRLITKTPIPTLRAATVAERRRRLLRRGDLLLEKSGGGDLQPVGVVVEYASDIPAISSNFVARLRPRPGFVGRYLTYLHFTLYSRRVNVRSVKQTTGIQNLDGDAYLAERVPLAPTNEQMAIARFLDYINSRIQRFIATQEQMINLAEEDKTATVYRVATRGVDPSVSFGPSGVHWIGDMPGHWRVRELRHLGRIQGGLTPSMERPDYWGGSIPWVSPKDMKQPYIDGSIDSVTPAALSGAGLRLIPPGSVLMVVRGMILARRVPVAVTSTEVTINQDMKAIAPSSDIDGAFLANVLNAAQIPLMEMIDEAGHGTRRLPTERWRRLSLPIPPLNEQRAIAAEVDRATSLVEGVRQSGLRHIALLREFRARLISDVVTGKLDVREAAAKLPDDPDADDPALDERLEEVAAG
jgi:type I restriction enzyme, S subunit